ncbi:MAG: hypothetical protein KJ880_07830, partial [Candidatus Omnitrophica bacterium]|nr:hypothetical protein [Candidatus Omnitrophota bacterium]
MGKICGGQGVMSLIKRAILFVLFFVTFVLLNSSRAQAKEAQKQANPDFERMRVVEMDMALSEAPKAKPAQAKQKPKKKKTEDFEEGPEDLDIDLSSQFRERQDFEYVTTQEDAAKSDILLEAMQDRELQRKVKEKRERAEQERKKRAKEGEEAKAPSALASIADYLYDRMGFRYSLTQKYNDNVGYLDDHEKPDLISRFYSKMTFNTEGDLNLGFDYEPTIDYYQNLYKLPISQKARGQLEYAPKGRWSHKIVDDYIKSKQASFISDFGKKDVSSGFSLNRFKIESKYKLGRNDTLTMAYDNILSQFGPDYNYEDFFENHFDVGFSHSLTRRTALFSGFGYSNRHYPNDRGKDADRYPFRLGLRHALTRKLWAQFEFDYEYADYWRSDKTMNNFGGIVDIRYKFGRQTTGGLRYRYLTMPSWRNHFM